MKYTKPRGTQDWFGKDGKNFLQVLELFKFYGRVYGLEYINTPIFESKDLFVRSVGASSDIVKKEFFEFKDKSERNMVLRPEGTAGVIRAVIENKLLSTRPLPLKFFYFAPMFRYERPQNGRLRQFYQFGVEIIGSSKLYDHVEILMLVKSLLEYLDIEKYEICVNNIGTFASRKKWIEALKQYFNKYRRELSPLSLSRLETNPLRILDDKEESKKNFVKKAPKINEFLTSEEKQEFTQILDILKQAKINVKVTPSLVRGLDYYNNFVFEVNSLSPKLMGQTTLGGGGQYDSLVNELGGPTGIGCKGFAFGVERLMIASKQTQMEYIVYERPDAVIASLDESCDLMALLLADKIREKQLYAITRIGTYKLDKYFAIAKETEARNVIIIGKDELKKKSVIIKNQVTMRQIQVLEHNVPNHLKLARKKH